MDPFVVFAIVCAAVCVVCSIAVAFAERERRSLNRPLRSRMDDRPDLSR